MRLRRLDLTRYGKFTDRRLDFGAAKAGAPDLHIVYGLNEAGKSTALSAYLDLLFGIEERSRYGFLHDYKLMEIGGCLEWDGGTHEIVRRKQRAGSLTGPDGGLVNEALVAGALSGLGRDAYRTMFSLDDETLEAGGDAILQSRGDLGELLFSGSSGLGRLGAHLAKAAEEADAIHKKRARSTEIAALKARLNDLKTERDAIDTAASTYRQLSDTANASARDYEAASAERGQVLARLERAERIARALPLAADLKRLRAELHAHADLPRPPASWAQETPRLLLDETRIGALAETLRDTIERHRAEINGLVPDGAILGEAAGIRHLTERLGADRATQIALPKRQRLWDDKNHGIAALLRDLGSAAAGLAPEALALPPALAATLSELIEARAGLDERRNAAANELAEAAEVLERARRQAEMLGEAESAETEALEDALAASRRSDAPARLRHETREIATLSRRAGEAVDALQPWRGEPAELRALDVPDARRVEAWRKRGADLGLRIAAERERLREVETRIGAERTRLDALQADAGAIDDETAKNLRQTRDAAWARHRESLNDASADAFEAAMTENDRLADARLSRARDLEDMRKSARDLALAMEAGRRARELLQGAEAERGELEGEVRASLPFRAEGGEGLDRLLDRLDGFERRRLDALARLDTLAEAEERAEAARKEIEADRWRLGEALAPFGFDAFADGDDMVGAAERFVAGEAGRRTERAGAARRLAECEAALATRERQAGAAAARFDEWSRRWSEALGQTWIAPGEGPAAVRALLDIGRRLETLLTERREIASEIAGVEAERQAFAAEVSGLTARLGAKEEGSSPADILGRLTERLDTAERAAHLRADKERSLAQLIEQERELGREQSRFDARRTEMLGFFGVETLREVSDAMERDAARARLETELAAAGNRLLAEMRAPSVDDASSELDLLDPAEAEATRAELAARAEDLHGRTRELYAAMTASRDALERVGGDDAAARLQGERQTVLLALEEAALRWLRLKAGLLVAQGALAAFRDEHRSTMMDRASAAFAAMTRGDYAGLSARPEKDRETLIGITRDGASKLAGDMSKGTRFQLYLSLRLAGYEEFASARRAVPFVADDIMETFDEPRSEEVLRLLAGMARTGQVVYLTHHRHLCDLAKQVAPDVRIHEI